MRARRRAALLVLLCGALVGACKERNPFEGVPERVDHGASQIWELGLEGFPNAFDVPTGRRFIVGADAIASSFGTFVLDARPDGTLVLRPFSTIAPGFSSSRVGIQDLGALSFEAVTEVPDGGYKAPGDSTGVPVVEGHSYALRISTQFPSGLLALNYAKVHVSQLGRQSPNDPRSRFVLFEWAYQNRPQERNVTVVDGGT